MNRSLVNITVGKILNLIEDNGLKAGDKLPTVDELAIKFSVGKSTIRESLKVLSTQNLIEIKQGAGTFILDKQNKDILEVFGINNIDDDIDFIFDMVTIRLIFEPEMAAMAAQFATRKDIQLIKECCNEVEALVKEHKDYHKEDARFHQAIAKASGNKVIQKFVKVIHTSIKKNIFMTDNTLSEDTIIFHKKITQCIERGDINGAKYAMIGHLDAQRQYLLERYKLKLL